VTFAASAESGAIDKIRAHPPQDLTGSFVATVRARAEAGELPLFAWSLGLPQPALGRLLGEFGLSSADLAQLTAAEFHRLEQLTPAAFHELRRMLFEHRTKLLDPAQADSLARALAGACFGSLPLWEDAGFADETELASFIGTFFAPLAQKYRNCRHWKREFFKDLHRQSQVKPAIAELLLKCFLLRQ